MRERNSPPSHQRRTPVSPHHFSESAAEEAEPMQIGRTWLSQEERGRQRQENLCLYCGQVGHFVSQCPVKRRAQQ